MRVLLTSLIVAIAIGAVFAGHPPAALSDQLLGHYYVIQKSLASDAIGGVAATAAKLADLSRSAAKREARGKAQLAALANASAKLQAKDIHSARNGFGELSNSLIAYLQTAQIQTDPPYQFYCSMVKKNWLQPDKQTRNPYYGSSMLRCGELVQSSQTSSKPMHH